MIFFPPAFSSPFSYCFELFLGRKYLGGRERGGLLLIADCDPKKEKMKNGKEKEKNINEKKKPFSFSFAIKKGELFFSFFSLPRNRIYIQKIKSYSII